MSSNGGYYLPQPSHWPLVGSLGLFLTLGGFAFALPVNKGDPMGSLMLTYIGLGVLTFMLYGWFGQVVGESGRGVYNDQVDRSFRMGMGWFIFSEVMFFAAFFGALYYIRAIILPEAQALAPDLNFSWPFSGTDGLKYVGTEIPKEGLGTDKFASVGAGGIPMWNTIILLTSGVTLTIAHWGLKKNNNAQLVLWLAVTVALGILFLGFQVYEYGHAWSDLNLRFGDPKHAMDEAQIAKLALTDPEAAKAATKAIWGQGAGVYASTFYLLTAFHGFHVFVGATILLVLLFRSMKRHFTEEHHFAFEAGAWYWHFVDVVWLGLFIFVYFLV